MKLGHFLLPAFAAIAATAAAMPEASNPNILEQLEYEYEPPPPEYVNPVQPPITLSNDPVPFPTKITVKWILSIQHKY